MSMVMLRLKASVSGCAEGHGGKSKDLLDHEFARINEGTAERRGGERATSKAIKRGGAEQKN